MADRDRDFTATEIKAGALVLASLVILVGFMLAIRGCGIRDESAKRYFVSFSDISGLNVGADVRFGGVKAGKVVAVQPDPGDRSQIRITAEVRGDVPVNEGSVASIRQVTLTAEKHLEISTGDVAAPLLESETELRSRAGDGGFIDMPELEGVTTRLERLLDGVIELVGVEEVRQTGGGEVVNLTQLTAALKDTLEESTGTVRGVNSVIHDNRQAIEQVLERLVDLEEAATDLMAELDAVVAENREPLRATMGNIERLTDQATGRLEQLATSLEVTLQHLEDTGGNASDLLDEQRPAIEEILVNLQEATRNLKELSRVLSEQPQALIRGAGQRGRTSEETK